MDQNKLYDIALFYLRTALNNPKANFRDGQWECIYQILLGKRVLSVQRTGWGKSMLYFIATKMLRGVNRGPTLLISPLLSLMRNQIEAANRLKINADTVNCTNRDDYDDILKRWQAGKIDLLIISPERLKNENFRNDFLVNLKNLGMFVVDEAHCISDWGHDFRPDYQRINRIIKFLPENIPLLATTATANDRVISDIKSQFGNNLLIQRGSLVRESLRLQNITMPSASVRLAWLAQTIKKIPGSGIIYTLTIHDANRVAEWLVLNGISAKAYTSKTGGENSSVRAELEQELLDNKVKVLVATVALGMGFDKPDLAFVIHYQRPASVVHYYQQVGRAGRAVNNAYGILLHGVEDDQITESFREKAFPPSELFESIKKCLLQENGLSIIDLQRKINYSQGKIKQALDFFMLQDPAPLTKEKTKYYLTSVGLTYQIDTAYIQRILDIRKKEEQQMDEYMSYKGCLMSFLQKALDDPHYQNCGKCTNCEGHSFFDLIVPNELIAKADIFLKRNYQDIEPRKMILNKKIPSDFTFNTGKSLCSWNDAGWGELVKKGKYKDNCFSKDLIDPCLKMIKEWAPNPFPTWMTCVPSLNRPKLVSDFAKILAERLGILFVDCVEKVKQNNPQKLMINSCQQYENVCDVFQVNSKCLKGSCFLFDDVVNSRWTFTVISKLLKEKGCSFVFPISLAKDRASGDD